jgi:hypothetical protein
MTYTGGKSQAGTYQTIINQIPPHRVYIEPFLGMGAILRFKKPAACSIAIDRNEDLIRYWQAQEQSIPGVTFICDDAISYLQSSPHLQDGGIEGGRGTEGGVFVYLDPPYLPETRKYRQYYLWEMTRAQHETLLQIALSLPCMVAISSYNSSLYSWYLQDWRHIEWQVITRGGSLATEHLWLNYPDPIALHDYRYLGDNYRERERITRKIKRWQRKLAHMPRLERQALLAAMAGTGGEGEFTIDDTTIIDDADRSTTPIYDDAPEQQEEQLCLPIP